MCFLLQAGQGLGMAGLIYLYGGVLKWVIDTSSYGPIGPSTTAADITLGLCLVAGVLGYVSHWF